MESLTVGLTARYADFKISLPNLTAFYTHKNEPEFVDKLFPQKTKFSDSAGCNHQLVL